MRELFEDSLEGVKGVLKNQLELAHSQGYRVRKVILTGGFGQSPSLQSRLRSYLTERMSIDNWEIDLIVPRNPSVTWPPSSIRGPNIDNTIRSTSVAKGAVLRALDKRRGPDRITQCSYGVLMSEPYEPDVFEAHRSTTCRINKDDGERYVDHTIFWVIQAVSHLTARKSTH